MNYPNQIKKNYVKPTSYANRGMDLEEMINTANKLYLEKNIAVIYKKPTPIQVVKYNYNTSKITEAFYQNHSTLDYNGLYKGYYIEFDAKKTEKKYLPLTNIANHQIEHIKKIIEHHGIVFLLIMIDKKCFILGGKKIIEFISKENRKSIPLEYIEKWGINVEYNYLKGVNYIDAIDKLIKKEFYEKN